MKIINLAMLFVFLFALSVSAQTDAKSAVKTESALKIEVEGGKILSLTAKDLAKFTRREVKAKAHDEKEATYSGFNLSDVLLDAGAKLGKDEMRGKELAAYLLVEAADGYKATFAIAEIAPEFTDKVVLLADTRDGKPLDEKEGVWQLIVPDDKKHGRWVRQVVKITVVKISDHKAVSRNSNDDDLIREVIFKVNIEQWHKRNTNRKIKSYYLAVDDIQDPSESLIKKFAGYGFPVKKVSESLIEPEGSIVTDKKTGKQGIIFSISKLEWKNIDEVKATGGNYMGNMASYYCLYTLRRENGEWKIVSSENCVIS